MRVFLGDQPDSVKVSRGRRSFGSLSGGPGDDLLESGPGGGAFTGGPGDDRMLGGTGSDSFAAGASLDGQDTMVGGRGSDTVDYSQRRRPVSADLDGRRDDGQRGERDRIVGVEGLAGGRAADRLVGDRHNNSLDGQGGSDQLVGGDGDDSLYGGGPAGPRGDRLYAGRGNDRISGDEGRDLLVAGPGVDWVWGGAGDDTVRARDGFDDRVHSDEDCDRVWLDAGDWLQTSLSLGDPSIGQSRCNRVRRYGAPGLFFQPVLTSADAGFYRKVFVEGAQAAVEIGCPGDAPAPCVGTVSIVRRGRRGGQASISLAPNDALSSLLVPLDRGFVAKGRRRTRATVVIRFRDKQRRRVERRTPVTLIFQ